MPVMSFETFSPPSRPLPGQPSIVTVQLTSARTGQHIDIEAEVVSTPEETARGLMNRTAVPEGTGMLFLFDPPREIAFWMKDTLVPLDIIFATKGGTIIKIAANAEPRSLAPIHSEGEVIAVLEIKGGEAQRLGLKVGDRLSASP